MTGTDTTWELNPVQQVLLNKSFTSEQEYLIFVSEVVNFQNVAEGLKGSSKCSFVVWELWGSCAAGGTSFPVCHGTVAWKWLQIGRPWDGVLKS